MVSKLKIRKSTRGRSKGIVTAAGFEDGTAFVTAAYIELPWPVKERLIRRLVLCWNLLSNLSCEQLLELERNLPTLTADRQESPGQAGLVQDG